MLFEREDIFERDEAHPSCHCSVIIELPGGELMSAWYAGKSEAHVSVGIKASWKESKDATGGWSAPVLIHKTPGRPDGNAVLAWYRDELHLYYNVVWSRAFPWQNVILRRKVSADRGHSWSGERTIIDKDDRGYTVRTKPLVVGERLIIPTGKERLVTQTGQVLYTEDGEDYRLGKGTMALEKGGCHQPAITVLGSGELLAYLRTSQRHIYQCTSGDLGDTWTVPEKTPLYCPNSALDFVRTPAGELVLAWNNVDAKGGMKNRKTLHVGYSPDEGKTWPVIKEIERDDADGRFAYPALIAGSDGLFHLTYTNRRRTIRHAVFDLDWLKGEAGGSSG